MMDVRQCPKDEVIPLFKKMVIEKNLTDIKHDGSDCFLTYKKGKHELRVWARAFSSASFEFHTGVHNIRFDGWFESVWQMSILKGHVKDGLGTNVSDFIKL